MISIVVGTNRRGAMSRRIGERLRLHYQSLGVTAAILDLADLPLEMFSPEAYSDKPASFQAFSDEILASSGLHIVVPEYNGGFPGVLKYFIDLLPFPQSFEGRPVAFTGVAAGMFGGLRPVEQLEQIFGYRNAYIFPGRVFAMQIQNSYDGEGRFSDAKLDARLLEQASGFSEFIEKLH